jgi:NAD(P)-dependent dehydrogenase (short-subunit alcohol dehydrogenase family)
VDVIDADIEAKSEMEKALMGEIPLNRWAKPEEIAGLAVYLASGEAACCFKASKPRPTTDQTCTLLQAKKSHRL